MPWKMIELRNFLTHFIRSLLCNCANFIGKKLFMQAQVMRNFFTYFLASDVINQDSQLCRSEVAHKHHVRNKFVN